MDPLVLAFGTALVGAIATSNQLLRAEPALGADLQRVLDEVLTPSLTPAGQVQIGTVMMTGSSHDSSTFNQIGVQTNYHWR